MPQLNSTFVPEAMAVAAAKNVVGILGPLLISAFVGLFFSGLLTIQGATYFRCFPNDNRWLKRLVGGAILLSGIQAISWMYLTWRWFVRGYGNWAAFFTTSWTFACEPIISQLTISLAQAFFVYRSYILTQRNKVLVFFLVCGMLASLVLFAAYSILIIVDPSQMPTRRFILTLALFITIATDVVITGVTTWKFFTARRGVNPSTDNGLSKLLHVTWEAAIPPALAAMANLLVVLCRGPASLMILLNILVPRLYVFSLMFTLNSRREIRRVFDSQPTRLPITVSGTVRNNRPLTTARIDFAHTHTNETESSDTRSTVEIPENGKGSEEYEQGRFRGFASGLQLPNRWREGEISDSGTVRTMVEGERLRSLPSTYSLDILHLETSQC